MAEFFYVLTVIYAAYVITVTIKDKKAEPVHIHDDSAESLLHPEHYAHYEPPPVEHPVTL